MKVAYSIWENIQIYTILYKGLEHPRILISAEVSEPIPLDTKAWLYLECTRYCSKCWNPKMTLTDNPCPSGTYLDNFGKNREFGGFGRETCYFQGEFREPFWAKGKNKSQYSWSLKEGKVWCDQDRAGKRRQKPNFRGLFLVIGVELRFYFEWGRNHCRILSKNML